MVYVDAWLTGGGVIDERCSSTYIYDECYKCRDNNYDYDSIHNERMFAPRQDSVTSNLTKTCSIYTVYVQHAILCSC